MQTDDRKKVLCYILITGKILHFRVNRILPSLQPKCAHEWCSVGLITV